MRYRLTTYFVDQPSKITSFDDPMNAKYLALFDLGNEQVYRVTLLDTEYLTVLFDWWVDCAMFHKP